MLMIKNTGLRMNIPTVLEELNDIRVIMLIYTIPNCQKMLSGISGIQKNSLISMAYRSIHLVRCYVEYCCYH